MSGQQRIREGKRGKRKGIATRVFGGGKEGCGRSGDWCQLMVDLRGNASFKRKNSSRHVGKPKGCCRRQTASDRSRRWRLGGPLGGEFKGSNHRGKNLERIMCVLRPRGNLLSARGNERIRWRRHKKESINAVSNAGPVEGEGERQWPDPKRERKLCRHRRTERRTISRRFKEGGKGAPKRSSRKVVFRAAKKGQRSKGLQEGGKM